ncbi:hypothetical protein N2W54_005844 [Lotmaria passim]
MAPVDVERVYTVFNLFAVNPGSGAAKEPYIPAFFLAVAAREVGFYPSTAAVHQFIKSVPTASAGEIIFAAFLQFCEDVAYTSRLGRADIYKLIDDLDPRGGGLISRRELFLLLTNGSADISDGEIDAVMEMLDPTLCGYVELKDLAALFIEHYHLKRSLSRISRSHSRHKSQPRPAITSVDSASVAGAAAPPQQRQLQEADRRRQHHHHDPQRTSQSGFPQPAPHRRVRRFAAGGVDRRSTRDRTAQNEPAPQPPHQTTSSTGGGAAAAIAERDRSFKRTDAGSNGEVAYRKYGSLYSRADTFERTQTAMTVDVDCAPSVVGTAMRHGVSKGAVHTPSPLSRRTHAGATTVGKSSSQQQQLSPSPPKGPASPLPLCPSANTAGASNSGGGGGVTLMNGPRSQGTSSRPSLPVAREIVADKSNKEAVKEESTDEEPHLHDENDEEANYYSRVEGATVVQPPREERPVASLADAPPPAAGGAAAPAAPSSPPKRKETQKKCCTMF